MGELVKMDDRGRITIPSDIRGVVGKRSFRVELLDKDTIVLRAYEDRSGLVKKIVEIRLVGEMERTSVDAAIIKDLYGWVKY